MQIKTIHKIFFYVFWVYIFSILFMNYFGYWDKPAKNQTIPNSLLANRSEIKGEILNAPAFYEKFHRKRIKFILQLHTVDGLDFANKDIKFFVDCNLDENYYPALGEKIKIYSEIEKLEYPNQYTNYLKYQNIYYRIQDNSLGNYAYDGKGNSIRHLFAEIRQSILDKILLLYSGMSKEILPALIIDERSWTSKATKKFLNSAGLSHITSISGTHIVFVFFLVSIFFRNKKSLFYILVSLATIWFYSGITGFSPSCVRSSLTLSLIIIANIFDRKSFTLNNFMLTAFFMLLLDPRQLFMISFLFSFLGVFSIFYFYNFWKNDVFGFLQKQDIKSRETKIGFNKLLTLPHIILKETFFTTMAAQTFMSPFVIFYFNALNFSAILFNLIVVPFVGLMMVFAFVSIFFSYFSFIFPVAKFFAFLNTFLITKTFGLSYYFYERCSVVLKKDIDYFYLTIILCILLIVPILKNITAKSRSLRLYLLWIILFMANILIYGLK